MDDPILDKVLEIVSHISGTKKISEATSINHDLPIDGDDAYELLKSVKNEFGTDFDRLDFHRYFHDEGEVFPFPFLWNWLPFIRKKKNLTVRHLFDAVKKGAWFDE